jgi:hypothetical protein
VGCIRLVAGPIGVEDRPGVISEVCFPRYQDRNTRYAQQPGALIGAIVEIVERAAEEVARNKLDMAARCAPCTNFLKARRKGSPA